MKKTKFSRFFESLIYFILLTIPLISVFARVIYVQSNSNAKDSYSGANVVQELTPVDSSLVINTTYYFNAGGTNLYNGSLDTISVYSNGVVYLGNSAIIQEDELLSFNLFYTTSTYLVFKLRNGTTQYQAYSSNIFCEFTFTVATEQNISSYYYPFIYIQDLGVLNTLDNAFDYGIQKTIDDFGAGNINFLNWFGTMFSNNNNLLYINFVNMYLNYALWVSVGYLLYYFLNWFIRFVREILDNLIYKETKN